MVVCMGVKVKRAINCKDFFLITWSASKEAHHLHNIHHQHSIKLNKPFKVIKAYPPSWPIKVIIYQFSDQTSSIPHRFCYTSGGDGSIIFFLILKPTNDAFFKASRVVIMLPAWPYAARLSNDQGTRHLINLLVNYKWGASLHLLFYCNESHVSLILCIADLINSQMKIGLEGRGLQHLLEWQC